MHINIRRVCCMPKVSTCSCVVDAIHTDIGGLTGIIGNVKQSPPWLIYYVVVAPQLQQCSNAINNDQNEQCYQRKDSVKELIACSSHDSIECFTSKNLASCIMVNFVKVTYDVIWRSFA